MSYAPVVAARPTVVPNAIQDGLVSMISPAEGMIEFPKRVEYDAQMRAYHHLRLGGSLRKPLNGEG
jgi:hypothetical protein